VSEAVPAPEPVPVFFSGGGTGGHLYPALALAEALNALRSDVAPYFVGAMRGIEARVLPASGYPHHLLSVEGFRRGGGAGALGDHLRTLRKLGAGLLALARKFRERRPALVVVSGGYAGAPSGILAILLGIPLVLQEQNAAPGVTTRLLSLGARRVYLAFPEARSRLPRPARTRAVLGGNPVRPPRPIDRASTLAPWGLDPSHPVLLVVGGSQGSLALNQGVLAMLRETPLDLGGFQLLWVTGPSHEEAVRRAVVDHFGTVPSWIRIQGYLEDMALALGVADLALSRAGAMGTSEFLAWGVPSILVPLPTAAADHQTKNALALEEAGAAILLRESDLTGPALHALLSRMGRDLEVRLTMAAAARRRGKPTAAAEMAMDLERLLPPPFPKPRSLEGRVG